MPAPTPVSPGLKLLLDWIDTQDTPAQDRLTQDQLETSGILASATRQHAQPHYSPYGSRTQASERLPLPGDVLGW